MNKLRFATSLATLGLLSSAAHAVVLANGGFETGDFTGWSGNLLASTVGAPGVGAQEGTKAAKLQGGFDVAEVNQTFAANPGDVAKMSGWMLTEATLPGGPSFGLFKIVFRDSLNVDIAFPAANVTIGTYNSSFPGAESIPQLTSSSAINTWTFSEVEVLVPANTVSVLFLALNVDFNTGPNPIWFDGIQASVIPEPTSVTMAGLGALALLVRRRRK